MKNGSSVVVAIAGALVGHLFVFLLIVALFSLTGALGAKGTAAPPVEEVTIMLADLVNEETLQPKEQSQHYVRTDADQETTKPEKAPFHSDHNTRAASEAPAVADAPPVPTIQSDRQLPVFEMRDRKYVDGEFSEVSKQSQPAPDGAAAASRAQVRPELAPKPDMIPAQASAAVLPEAPSRQPDTEKLADKPEEDRSPEVAPDLPPLADGLKKTAERADQPTEAAKIRPSEQVGRSAEPVPVDPAKPLLEQKPNPMAVTRPTLPDQPAAQSATAGARGAPDAPPTPKPPSRETAFNPETHRNQTQGSIGRRGEAAVDAEANALGRYKKQVLQTIERKWHQYRGKYADFVTYGTLRITFRVDRQGNPKGMRIVRNDTSAVTAEFTVKAILDADIPPMPADVATLLGERGLEIDYRVLLY
ncbi:MAG: hypothetical protein H7A54_11225 [Akkermansiaceae bacterium]|nr:hypothetical protein [Akkermansiaceae bacterium]